MKGKILIKQPYVKPPHMTNFHPKSIIRSTNQNTQRIIQYLTIKLTYICTSVISMHVDSCSLAAKTQKWANKMTNEKFSAHEHAVSARTLSSAQNSSSISPSQPKTQALYLAC